jgi:hypothetical protein
VRVLAVKAAVRSRSTGIGIDEVLREKLGVAVLVLAAIRSSILFQNIIIVIIIYCKVITLQ